MELGVGGGIGAWTGLNVTSQHSENKNNGYYQPHTCSAAGASVLGPPHPNKACGLTSIFTGEGDDDQRG